ncbi:hypothetical protein N2152v2_000585 [Parachlorella kessleri]
MNRGQLQVLLLLALTLGTQSQQAPARVCSLTLAGTTHKFDACPSVNSDTPFQLFFSATTDAASGGTLVHGGLRAQQDAGWVGWGLGVGRMWGSYTAIVKAPPGAAPYVEGYILPRSYDGDNVNAAAGTWALSSAEASLENGQLMAVFVGVLPSSISLAPLDYIWASGSLSRTANGQGKLPLAFHSDYGVAELFMPPSASSSPGQQDEGQQGQGLQEDPPQQRQQQEQQQQIEQVEALREEQHAPELHSQQGQEQQQEQQVEQEQQQLTQQQVAEQGGRRQQQKEPRRLEEGIFGGESHAASKLGGEGSTAERAGKDDSSKGAAGDDRDQLRVHSWLVALASWAALLLLVWLVGSRLKRRGAPKRPGQANGDKWLAWQQQKDPAHEV